MPIVPLKSGMGVKTGEHHPPALDYAYPNARPYQGRFINSSDTMAYDFAFDHANLAREFLKKDFKLQALANPEFRNEIVATAVNDASLGLRFMALDEHVGRKASTYQASLITHELILRKLNRNLKYLTRVQQADRETIIKALRSTLKEGHSFNVYRLDIEKFYESIDLNSLRENIGRDGSISRSTLKVLDGFVSAVGRRAIPGVPRGLSISSTLSELYLRKFDRSIERAPNVYYYARYVDDIIVVTTANEDRKDFLRFIRSELPRGLRLNRIKSDAFNFQGQYTKNPTISGAIEFLGYAFHVHQVGPNYNKQLRKVTLDISSAKVRRFKTRLCKSLITYQSERDFETLKARIGILTGNYNLYDQDKGLSRNLGVYFNYRFIDFADSKSLPEMDRFLKFCLLSAAAPTATAAQSLTNIQRRSLLARLPSQAHRNRTFHHIPTDNLIRAVECWKHD